MKKTKVIIADDNKNFIEGLQVLLSMNEQFEIIDICYNGEELLNSKYLPIANLVLSDIDMPELDGISACKQINYKYPEIPLIALTMYIDKVFLEDIIQAGFKGFVHKPDTATNLLDVIKKVLNNQFIFPSNLQVK